MRTYFPHVAFLGILACGGAAESGRPRNTDTAGSTPNADSLATVELARAALVAIPLLADLARDSVTIFRTHTAGTVLRFGRPAFCGPATNCDRPSAVVLVRPNGKAEFIPGVEAWRFLGPDSAS
jgi:hypothetical protein